MPADRIWMAQRAIVLQLLRNDHWDRWTRPELETEIEDFDQQTIVDALALINFGGVAVFERTAIWASRCARHLDSLDLISI